MSLYSVRATPVKSLPWLAVRVSSAATAPIVVAPRPPHASHLLRPHRSWSHLRSQGGDSAAGALGADGKDFTPIYEFVRAGMKKSGDATVAAVAKRTEFIPGFFNESLNDALLRRFELII